VKVGDLVKFKGSDLVIGIIVDLNLPNPPNTLNRVGILWTDGDGIDYEPKAWLEVISEGR
jgi:hypothetical protein